MLYVQSLTLEGCFHIHLLRVESFSLTKKKENSDFERMHEKNCDVTQSLRVNPDYKV